VATEVTSHRFDAERYGRIVASGALRDERVALIDGGNAARRASVPRAWT
jgi:hypothetical protein